MLLPITRIGRWALILMDPSLNSLCSNGDYVLKNDIFDKDDDDLDKDDDDDDF